MTGLISQKASRTVRMSKQSGLPSHVLASLRLGWNDEQPQTKSFHTKTLLRRKLNCWYFTSICARLVFSMLLRRRLLIALRLKPASSGRLVFQGPGHRPFGKPGTDGVATTDDGAATSGPGRATERAPHRLCCNCSPSPLRRFDRRRVWSPSRCCRWSCCPHRLPRRWCCLRRRLRHRR